MPAPLECAHCGATSQDPAGWKVAVVTMRAVRASDGPKVETVVEEVLCPRCAEAAGKLLKEDTHAAVH